MSLKLPENSCRFFMGGFPESYKGNLFKTDFRVWLQRDYVLARNDITDVEKVEFSLRCYRNIVEGTAAETLLQGIAWFAGCGETDRIDLLDLDPDIMENLERIRNTEEDADKPLLFSFYWDFKEVWASFYATYRIDLFKETLHWWGFKALLAGLDGESALSRLMQSRQYDKKDKDLRKFYMTKVNAVPKEGQDGWS
jgi:hypothetical protein